MTLVSRPAVRSSRNIVLRYPTREYQTDHASNTDTHTNRTRLGGHEAPPGHRSWTAPHPAHLTENPYISVLSFKTDARDRDYSAACILVDNNEVVEPVEVHRVVAVAGSVRRPLVSETNV